MSRVHRAILPGLAASTLALFAPAARGQTTGAAPEITVEAAPVLGSGGTILAGWNEVLVRIQNNGSKPARGEVSASAMQYSHDTHTFVASAPYNVAAGSSVQVRVPIQVGSYGDLNINLTSESGTQVAATHISSAQTTGLTLADISETSRIRGAINDVAVSTLYVPSHMGGSSTAPTLNVASPRFDPATGDAVLPDRAALYSTADAVLIRSDVLSRVQGAELDALAGYVLSGGTLAVVITRPEDIRHPTLTAFAGGPIAKVGVSANALHELFLPSTSSFGSSPSKLIPHAKNPTKEVAATLAGYAGGNLHGSPYGNSAFYGLGEVHLLAFDAISKPAVDDPWVQSRIVDLTRRAFDRRSTQVFRPGSEAVGANYVRVRQQLDPNQGSRWAIGVATLLLCIYAVLAGPVNFSLASRKGKPLRALRHLPIYAAVTFAAIVATGIAAKGFTGRARHLTLIEAGAGMSKGSARRFRGFFASRAKDLTVRTTDGSSVASTAILAESADRKDHLMVDREGARLVDVAALPWQTVVIREDGFGSLGDGISMVQDGESGVTVVNRSGHDLRSLILRLPNATMVYAPRLKDGDKLSSSGGAPLSSLPDGAGWESQVTSFSSTPGLITIHHLAAGQMQRMLESDAPGLGAAWAAIDETAGDSVDWFPDNAPVLLAQLDGGEGRASDSGLRVESDRVLLRIVGFGGRP